MSTVYLTLCANLSDHVDLTNVIPLSGFTWSTTPDRRCKQTSGLVDASMFYKHTLSTTYTPEKRSYMEQGRQLMDCSISSKFSYILVAIVQPTDLIAETERDHSMRKSIR